MSVSILLSVTGYMIIAGIYNNTPLLHICIIQASLELQTYTFVARIYHHLQTTILSPKDTSWPVSEPYWKLNI